MSPDSTRAWFVTGTDTGVGKTWVSAGLMRLCAGRGLRTAGMKPVASGGANDGGLPANEDARCIFQQCTTAPAPEDVNPFTFAEPIAPHLAAAHEGRTVTLAPIEESFARLCAACDVVVVEGVGGWRVPLAPDLQTADLVRALQLPVILVVGLRLGCINHALLTAESVQADGVVLAGWVANRVDADYLYPAETVEYLSGTLPAPLLGDVPTLPRFDADQVAAALAGNLLPEP